MFRGRALIEAYTLPPEKGRDEAQIRDASSKRERENREAAVLRALDFLDSCLRPLSGTESTATLDDTVAESVGPAGADASEPRHSAWRIPRGLLYWLSVGASASVTWRLSRSVLEAAIAGLLASAAMMLLELVLRTIDPRTARRLGLARGHSGAFMYGAGAAVGAAAGMLIAYLL